MALEREARIRAIEMDSISAIAQAASAATPRESDALTALGQFGATLTAATNQISALIGPSLTDATAGQAINSGSDAWKGVVAAFTASPMVAAEQTWQNIASLSASRLSALQEQWQLGRNVPPPLPAEFQDDVFNAINRYATVVTQVDQRLRSALLAAMPAPPVPPPSSSPPGTYANAATNWLTSLLTAFAPLVPAVNSAVAQVSASDTNWAWVVSKTQPAQQLAQQRGQNVQRIATALAPGPLPTTPDTLAELLAGLSDLRTSAWPSTVTPGTRDTYAYRMQELDPALVGLLAASSGATTTPPLALLPVRLETRIFPGPAGSTELRLRVFVDDIHVNAHDPRLTAEEAAWSTSLQHAVTVGGDAARVAWAQAADRFGATRAAYLLRPTADIAQRASAWEQPATAGCLPDRWLAVAYGTERTPIAAALSKPIKPKLQVGPNPSSSVSPFGAQQLSVDPGLRWLVDFDAAIDTGMAMRLPLDGGATAGATTIGRAMLSRVVVVGVRGSDATTDIGQLLTAHRYTDGLELISSGTPTNTSPEAPAGYSSLDPGHAASFHREVENPARGTPTGDAARLAAAFGLSPAVFAGAGDAILAQRDQQAMMALSWPVTWGYFLTQLTGMGAARAERLRSWAVAWLRPGGPLPVVRVGRQPYGVLPVMAMQGWADAADPAAGDVYQVVGRVLPTWTSTYDAALRGTLDFDALLERRAVTADVRGRFAGVMAGWLTTGNGLLGVGSSLIQARLQSAASWLAQLGQQLGLPGPLTWPSSVVVLPDWVPSAAAPPWPLTSPLGSMPLAGASPDPYVAALAARQPPPRAASLVGAVAATAWARTVGAAASSAGFVPRGFLGEAPEPAAPNAADELSGAVAYLGARADADLASLLGGALDVASHRLDAWATALATRRLGQLRQASASGVLVGGFGWVENLQQRPPLQPPGYVVAGEPNALADPTNAGHLQAPSLQQATTAAVLRSGFLTHNPPGSTVPPDAPFAVDLSSRRARLAIWLLDGVRQGQPLAALLGYRFERALQESGRADLIDQIRRAMPYDPAISPDGVPPGPTEAVRATDVVDGVTLLDRFRGGQLVGPPWTVDAVARALQDLALTADAVADAVLAQGVHDALTGSTTRAAASFASLASGAVPPPDPEFLRTPRTGRAIVHRVVLPLPVANAPLAGWPNTPRARAAADLNAWLASLLGDATRAVATVALTDTSGAPLPAPDNAAPIALAQLGAPLDILALAERPAELERLAVSSVLASRAPSAPAAIDGSLDDNPPGTPNPLGDLMPVVRAAARMLASSRAADARDLAPAGVQVDPRVDTVELGARVRAAADDLANAASALASALAAADAAAVAAALIGATRVGVAGAAPSGWGLASLTGQAQAALAVIGRRQAAFSAAAPPPGADAATLVAGQLGQLRVAFGGSFTSTPRFTTDPPDLLAHAQAQTSVDGSDAGQTPEAWLAKAAHVRPALAELVDVRASAEAMGLGPPLALSVAQLPLTATPTRWAGQPFGATPPAANTVSLTLIAPNAPTRTLAALLVDDWIDVIPSARETTGIAYHFDAPGAQAPQSILLAVPANRSRGAWTYADLLDTLNTTLDLAHARAVDYGDLPPPAQFVLPAIYLDNGADGVPTPVPVRVPADYLVQEPSQQTITAVSAMSVQQGATAPLSVLGVNLSSAAFVFDAPGVAVTGVRVTPGAVDTAVVTLAVDREAAVGPRAIKAGSSAFVANAVTVTWRPRADSCNTSQLAQQLTDTTQQIVVSGHGLLNAAADLTGSPDAGISAQATSDTTVTLGVTIAASSYDPSYYYEQPAPTYPKPRPAPVPRHVSVPLALTVTPRNGTATTFAINLDTIV